MNEYGDYKDATNPDNEWTIRTGCIRLDPAGPYVHANSAHIAVGISDVEVVGSALRIYHEDSSRPGTVIVIGDETTAAKGLHLGSSGGSDYTNVYFYHPSRNGAINLSNPTDYAFVSATTHNLWVLHLTPSVRGVGNPSKVDLLESQVSILIDRVSQLENLIT